MDLLYEANLTQQQFADLYGVRRETVSNWITGKTVARFTPAEMRKLCEVLGKRFEDLPDTLGPTEPSDTAE
jgi:transcriptional regulator with XRE-family HTH domain